MIRDTWVVALKELKELKVSKEFIIYYLMLIVVAGILIPISSFGADTEISWYLSAFVFVVIASVVPSGLTADTFAGEKERKTLETLLSSPLSTISIYLGKMAFIVFVSMTVITSGFVMNVISSSVIRFVHLGSMELIKYPALALYVIFVGSLAISNFIAFLGVGVSLVVRSVRTANLITFFVGTPLIIPIIQGLMRADITWAFVNEFLFVTVGLCLFISLVTRRFFKRSWIMKRF